MRFFKLRPPPQTDPVFGKLGFKRGSWEGQFTLPGETEPTVVSIEADQDGPRPEQRRIFEELVSQFPITARSISTALFDLYRPYLELDNWEGPKADSPQSLREMLGLDCITILKNDPPELLFGFLGDVWPDAMFTVSIDNGHARPISLDD
jgi:hypothetical protein